MQRFVFCALTCMASVAFAQRTISVNFGTNGVASTIPSDNTVYAGVQSLNVTCDLWNNMSGNNETLSVVKSSTTNNCGASVVVAAAQAAWGPGTDSSRINGHENRKLLGRYMDLSSGNQYTVTISNIPFAKYKVYVILAGDGTGTYASMIVNGVNYCGSGNSTIPGTSSWGTRTGTWATLQSLCGDSYLKEGVNYLTVTNLFGTLIVKNAISANRATLAAIQIEEIPYAGIAWKGAGANNYWGNSTNWWSWPVTNQNISFIGTNRVTNTNDFIAGTLFSNITFEASTGYGSTNWTITGNAITLSGNLALKTAQTVGMSNSMFLAVSPVISVTNGGTMTLSGILSNVVGGTMGITKEGQGMLALSAQNTFTGNTTVKEGTLNLTGGGGTNGTICGTVTVYTNATLRLSAADAFGYNNTAGSVQTVNLIGGTMDCSAGANQTTVADFYMTGAKIIGGVNIDLFNNVASVTTYASDVTSEIINTSLGLRQNDSPFTVADGVADIDLLVGAKLINNTGGNHNLVKNGAGRMVLTNALNAYTGTTTVNGGGIFEVAGIGRLNSGAYAQNIIINSGTFRFSSSNNQTLSGVISGAGTFSMEGSSVLTLSGNNTLLGTLTITNGTVVPKHAGAFGAGTVNVGGAAVIDMTVSGVIAPTRPIALSGTPTIRTTYTNAQDLTVVTVADTTTLIVDVLNITTAGVYKLLNASSNLGVANFTLQLVNSTPGLTAQLTSDTAGVYLDVSVAPKAAVTWKNLASGDWDTATPNWTTNGVDVTFADGDQVVLPDYSGLDAATLTLKGDYTLTSLSVAGNETDYTIALDTGTSLVTRAFSKTGGGAFTFPGTLTVTPGSIQNATGTVTVGTLTAPGLTLVNGASVTVTNDASRILSVTLVTNSTLTIPSAAVVPNNVTVAGGTYPAQALIRYAGGSGPATTFPFGGKQATFKIEKEVDLGASGCYISGNQALVIGNGGLLRTTNDVVSCATARLIMNEGGSIISKKIAFGNTSAGHTSTIVQNGGTIEVTGNVSADANTSSIMLAHWDSYNYYDMNGGSFIADNAQVLMALDGKGYWTIASNAYVRTMGIRIRADGDAGRITTLNLNGGLVEIGSRGLTTGGPLVSVLNLGGSTIRALADFSINISTATINLTAGTTSTLDLNGKTVTKASEFAGTGTLCITNTGRIAQSVGYIISVPNLLFVGNAGLLMKLDNALATSEKFTTGVLTLQNSPSLSFTLDLQNKTKLQKQYPLIEATSITGDLAGATVSLWNNGAGMTCTLEIQGNTVYAVLSGGNLADPVYWKDLSSGSWDKSMMNWVTNGVDILYDDDKRVVFDDLAVNASSTVTVTEPVNPEHISFESDTTAYTVVGSSRITVPVVSCTGTNATMISAPLTANIVELLTNTLVTVSEPTSWVKASQIGAGATLAIGASALGNIPTGTGMLELLAGTYALTNINLTSGTVKVDAGTRAECEYTLSTTKPVTSITGAGTFAFFSTNAVQAQLALNPVLTFPGLTGTFALETVGPMRMANANWKTTLQNLPSTSTLFMGKGMQYYGAPFVMNARVVFEDGAQLADHFQDTGPSTFGQLRFGSGTTWFSNNVHLGTSSIIRIGSDAASTVWFRHSITGPGSTIQFGSGYTPLNNALQVELDCSNSAETLSIRNNGGTGRVTVNAWGASSLANNLVSETSGASGSFIVNIGDAATLVNAAIRTVNGSNASDEIRLNHASGSLTIDGNANSTYPGLITKVGKLIKSGNGTLTLSGNNTFGGGFVLNAGTVVPKHANALGTNSTVTLNGGVLDLSAVGAVMPAQTNVVATGTPSIRMNCTSSSDPTINGITGVVTLSVVTAAALEGVEYKLINSSTTLSLTNFTVSLTDWNVGFGVLTAKADGIYLSLKRGTMIQFQ